MIKIYSRREITISGYIRRYLNSLHQLTQIIIHKAFVIYRIILFEDKLLLNFSRTLHFNHRFPLIKLTEFARENWRWKSIHSNIVPIILYNYTLVKLFRWLDFLHVNSCSLMSDIRMKVVDFLVSYLCSYWLYICLFVYCSPDFTFMHMMDYLTKVL